MDTMLMLRHYLHKLTASEFHCFLVGNHSTVAGFAFATFVMFGVGVKCLMYSIHKLSLYKLFFTVLIRNDKENAQL